MASIARGSTSVHAPVGARGARGRVRVLIVDEDPLARAAVRDALERAPGFAVIGATRSAREAVQLALDECPDVVVIDVRTAGADGLLAIRRLRRSDRNVTIVVLCACAEERLALLCLRAGAVGSLDKSMDLALLPRVLRKATEGEAAISRVLTRTLIEELFDDALLAREWEVFELLCSGASLSAIAAEAGVSIREAGDLVDAVARKLTAGSIELSAASRPSGAGT